MQLPGPGRRRFPNINHENRHHMAQSCSAACYQNCPNIVDLYFNLAAGEGEYLPALCEKQRANPHRAMLELLSNGGGVGGGDAARGPMVADFVVDAPGQSPVHLHHPGEAICFYSSLNFSIPLLA